MFGAIAGDIIGSIYEMDQVVDTNFPLFKEHSTFTDDSVLTVAVAHAILNQRPYRYSIHAYGNRYPNAGYGGRFKHWLKWPVDEAEPYDSFGNGSGMRVSPVGFAFNDLEKVLQEAEASAAPSHNHPEGIKGAQAIASTILGPKWGF